MKCLSRRIFLEPTKNDWESKGVFNPTVIEHEGVRHLFYRGVKEPNFSSIGHVKIKDGVLYRRDKPILWPTEEYEKVGVEDPRITYIEADKKFHLLYTAYDGRSACVGYAVSDPPDSEGMFHFEKQGIVSPKVPVEEAMKIVGAERYKGRWKYLLNGKGKNTVVWDKDAVLFPEKIRGKYAMLHRLDPDVQIIYFDSFKELQDDNFWRDYIKNIEEHVFMRQRHKWEDLKIGAGAVPVKTPYGWLLIYHAIEGPYEKRVYRAAAALADFELKNEKRLEKPLFEPEFEWEKVGSVPDVVFPTGAIVDNGKLLVWYGAADTRIGLAEIDFEQLMKSF